MSDAPSPARPAQSHGRKWRFAAVAMLLFGLLAASVDYWVVSRSQLDLENPALLGFYKKERHQMGEFFGRSGYLMEDLKLALAQPAVQASLILAGSGLLAWGCWSFSRRPEPPDDDFFKPSQTDEANSSRR